MRQDIKRPLDCATSQADNLENVACDGALHFLDNYFNGHTDSCQLGKVAENLKHGAQNAINANNLVILCSYHTKRELRREIERERRGGVLILANQHGYFLPSENEEEARHELSEFVRSAEKKSKSLLLTIKHAKAALKQCLGQTELFEVGNDATA